MWPTRKAILYAAAVLPLGVPAALISPFFLWPYLAAWLAFLCAAAIDAAILAVGSRALALTPQVPGAVPVGEASIARFSLRLPAAARRAAVTFDLSGGLAPQGETAVEVVEGVANLELPLVPRRRGEAVIERAWVRFDGPLGMIERVVALPVEERIVVTVNFPAVRRTAIAALRMEEFRVGPRIERFLGEGTEFDGLREYAPGFDTRSLDWKASARHRRLLVRQYRAERNQHVVLAVDTGRLMAEPLGGVPRLDHAIEAALLLGYVSLRSADQVSAFAFDAEVRGRTRPFKGVRATSAFLEFFSRLAYTDLETNFTYGLTTLLGWLPRRALVVVFTDFVDSITAELMCDNLLRLAERHLVVFVAARDADVEELARTPPSDAGALNRAIVAGTLLQERDRVFKRLRRAGVWCVDAPPGPLALEVVRRYLAIKRRELI